MSGGGAGEFDRDEGGDGGKSGGSGAERGPKIWNWGATGSDNGDD